MRAQFVRAVFLSPTFFFNRRPCETLSSHESLIRLFQPPAITDTLRFTLSLQQRHEKLVKRQKRGETEQHCRGDWVSIAKIKCDSCWRLFRQCFLPTSFPFFPTFYRNRDRRRLFSIVISAPSTLRMKISIIHFNLKSTLDLLSPQAHQRVIVSNHPPQL